MILGFDKEKKYFKNGVFFHAYIFYGQEAIGKKSFALELAKTIAGDADILITSDTQVEDFRKLKDFMSLSPFQGDKKVAIIDNAHKMTVQSQNALLKLLEEPSESSVFFLITSQIDKLLPTIRSRCYNAYFSPHPRSVFDRYFEGKKLSEEQKKFLYEFSNGSIGLVADIDDFKVIKNSAEEFNKIIKADINKRFDIAKELSTDENLIKKVFFWMLYLRSKKMFKYLAPMLSLYKSIIKPQFREQLALEIFMLELI